MFAYQVKMNIDFEKVLKLKINNILNFNLLSGKEDSIMLQKCVNIDKNFLTKVKFKIISVIYRYH